MQAEIQTDHGNLSEKKYIYKLVQEWLLVKAE